MGLDALITDRAKRLDGPGPAGVLLSGSRARGSYDAWSDVDLLCFLRDGAAVPDPREELEYVEGTLFSTTFSTVSSWGEHLSDRELYIHAVPAFRRAVVLIDNDGGVARLKLAAGRFVWEVIRPRAERLAAESTHHLVEDVHKMVGGLTAGDEYRVLAATLEIVQRCSNAVACAGGVLIDSANTFFRQVEAAARDTPGWAEAFREATGLRGLGTVSGRGEAALRLYAATAVRLRRMFTPPERAVVEEAVRRMSLAWPSDDSPAEPRP